MQEYEFAQDGIQRYRSQDARMGKMGWNGPIAHCIEASGL